MPKIKGTIETIKDWEKHPKALMKMGMAQLVYETGGKPLFDAQAGEGSASYIAVYHVFVGSGANRKRVKWIFRFDSRVGEKSSLEMSQAGWQAMLHSMTLMGVMENLNIGFAGEDGFNPEKFKLVMEEAVRIVAEKKLEKVARLDPFPKGEIFDEGTE